MESSTAVLLDCITFAVKQVIGELREADVGMSQGQMVGQVSQKLGVTEKAYYRRRKEDERLPLDQAKKFKYLARPMSYGTSLNP